MEKAVNVETVVEADWKATHNFGEHTKPNQGEKQNYNKGQKFNKRRDEAFGGQSCYKGNSGICFSCGQQGDILRNVSMPSTEQPAKFFIIGKEICHLFYLR